MMIFDMKAIEFNYHPNVALKAIKKMVDANKKDAKCSVELKKIYEDILTLVELGCKTLKKQPNQSVPAEPANTKKS